MTPAELEETYERLARAIDVAGEEGAPIYLAKLALLLAQRIGDVDVVTACLEDAGRRLP